MKILQNNDQKKNPQQVQYLKNLLPQQGKNKPKERKSPEKFFYLKMICRK